MKYLNKNKQKLFEGEVIVYRGYAYWANMVVGKIYRRSAEAFMCGCINGNKYADIIDGEIVK